MKISPFLFLTFSILFLFACEQPTDWNCQCTLDNTPPQDYIMHELKEEDADESCSIRRITFEEDTTIQTVNCELIKIN